ncbi:hypothetical protein EZS27_032756 [termite gut metagenome]|uniref:Uncharacterized protein n=1 Tax=termite gut metagenome TaxID=433724 RepID=A0A5J4Q5G1_9ZZZZ
MVVMVITILGLVFAIGGQRQTISQYQDNELKYRCIKCRGRQQEKIFIGWKD